MKYSDVLIDLYAGDTSIHDVYMEEAICKIDIASKYFDTIDMILEALEYEPEEIDEVVLEAAEAEGIKANDEVAMNATTDKACVHAAIAYYDLMIESAKKAKESVDKCFAALIGIAKKFGISSTGIEGGNFVHVFAMPLANALVTTYGARSLNPKAVRNAAIGVGSAVAGGMLAAPMYAAAGLTDATAAAAATSVVASSAPSGLFSFNRPSKKIETWTKGFLNFTTKTFLKSNYTINIVHTYGNAISYGLAAYGLDISDVFKDKTLQEYLGFNEQTIGGKVLNDVMAVFRVDPVVKKRDKSGYYQKAQSTMNSIEKTMNKSAASLASAESYTKGKLKYRDKANAEEIGEFIIALYAMKCIIGGILDSEKKLDRSQLTQTLSAVFSSKTKERKKKNLMDSIKTASGKLRDTTNVLVKTFGDSTTAIVNVSK